MLKRFKILALQQYNQFEMCTKYITCMCKEIFISYLDKSDIKIMLLRDKISTFQIVFQDQKGRSPLSHRACVHVKYPKTLAYVMVIA